MLAAGGFVIAVAPQRTFTRKSTKNAAIAARKIFATIGIRVMFKPHRVMEMLIMRRMAFAAGYVFR
jgi:hypothetical protein